MNNTTFTTYLLKDQAVKARTRATVLTEYADTLVAIAKHFSAIEDHAAATDLLLASVKLRHEALLATYVATDHALAARLEDFV